MGGDLLEFVSHLSVSFDLVSSVWYNRFKWLGLQTSLPRETRTFFDLFLSLGVKANMWGGFNMIYRVVV